MDEEFIMRSMQMMGENGILSVKVIKNKFTGGAAGYGFINFSNDQVALTCMHKLNGKIIPNTNPPVRFKLNHNSNRLLPGEKNHSIWVGDLTPEVDDLNLYKFFAARFQSIVSAKVVLDEHGTSKGFGFIRFSNEVEQQTAMTSMVGLSGLGGKPIKVSAAVQKDKKNSNWNDNSGSMDIPAHVHQAVAQSVIGGGSSSSGGYGGADYSSPAQPNTSSAEYYNQYWSQYAAWQHYNQQWQQYSQGQQPPQPGQEQHHQGGGGGAHSHPFGNFPPAPPPPMEPAPPNSKKDEAPASRFQKENDGKMGDNPSGPIKGADKRKLTIDERLEADGLFGGPPNKILDHGQSERLEYSKLNKKRLSNSEELYSRVQESQWLFPPGEEV